MPHSWVSWLGPYRGRTRESQCFLRGVPTDARRCASSPFPCSKSELPCATFPAHGPEELSAARRPGTSRLQSKANIFVITNQQRFVKLLIADFFDGDIE